jgi:hypothetical protein
MRPAVGEDTANSVLFGERLYAGEPAHSLSDTAADISNLPTIDTTKPPVSLDGNWNVAADSLRGLPWLRQSRRPPCRPAPSRRR